MPLPLTLLNEILASPDDDLPRKNAAQWFRNNTFGTRALFIEKQLSLAVLAYNPTHKNFELESDIQQLLESHIDQWRGLDGLATSIDNVQYHRGFIELITISAEIFLQHAPAIFALAPIRHLNLTNVAPVAEALFESPYLENIVTLSLHKCDLTDEHMALLANSPYVGNLRWLSLMLNNFSMTGIESLAKSTSLEQVQYINFYGNEVDPTEELVVEQGVITQYLLPAEGKFLEENYGPIRWLHVEAELESDYPPDRFMMVY